jgi:hypothetical protein
MKKIPLPLAIGLLVIAVATLALVLRNRESEGAYSSAVSQEIKSDPNAPLAPGPANILGRGGGPRKSAVPAPSSAEPVRGETTP